MMGQRQRLTEQEYLENPLPSAVEAEEVCLGSVLLDNEIFPQLMEVLDPEDFYVPWHRVVYGTMQALYSEGTEIDPITIGEGIKKQSSEETLLNIGGVTRITGLTYGLPHFSNVGEYVKIVKEHSVSRISIRLFNARIRDILAGDTPIAEILDNAEKKVMALNNTVHGDRTDRRTGFSDLSEIAPALREQFERYHQGISTGVKTGMKPLDDMLDGGGLQRKAVYVVAGAEKSGKTSLALEWVRNISIEQGLATAVVTLEMSKESLGKRLYSMQTGISYFMFRPGMYDTEKDPVFSRAVEGLEKFSQYPIHIADALFGMTQIERYCTRLVEDGHKPENPEVGLIVLDYLQLIGIEEQPNLQDVERVGRVSRRIKLLASELDVPVVVMSNLNRIGMADGAIPDTRNLRDSQAIAFDAEAVMFVHNPAYVPGKPYTPQEITDMQLIMSRQRNGPTGMIPLKFIGPYMSFMTEGQFNKHFANSRVDRNMPESKGESLERDTATENLWDEDDDEYESE